MVIQELIPKLASAPPSKSNSTIAISPPIVAICRGNSPAASRIFGFAHDLFMPTLGGNMQGCATIFILKIDGWLHTVLGCMELLYTYRANRKSIAGARQRKAKEKQQKQQQFTSNTTAVVKTDPPDEVSAPSYAPDVRAAGTSITPEETMYGQAGLQAVWPSPPSPLVYNETWPDCHDLQYLQRDLNAQIER